MSDQTMNKKKHKSVFSRSGLEGKDGCGIMSQTENKWQSILGLMLYINLHINLITLCSDHINETM